MSVYDYGFDLTNMVNDLGDSQESQDDTLRIAAIKWMNMVHSFPGTGKHYVRSHTEMKR